jgi:ADP-ribosylglycohydrolase
MEVGASGEWQLPNPLGDGGVPDADEVAALRALVQQEPRPGSGVDFQIASVHMCPCVMWCVCRGGLDDPRLAVLLAIDLGGDTDTTAAMAGAVVGALHGDGWLADWAEGLENGAHGRDYIVQLASDLARLDVRG